MCLRAQTTDRSRLCLAAILTPPGRFNSQFSNQMSPRRFYVIHGIRSPETGHYYPFAQRLGETACLLHDTTRQCRPRLTVRVPHGQRPAFRAALPSQMQPPDNSRTVLMPDRQRAASRGRQTTCARCSVPWAPVWHDLSLVDCQHRKFAWETSGPIEGVVDAGSVHALKREAIRHVARSRSALMIIVHVEDRVVQAARLPHNRDCAIPAQTQASGDG